MLSQKVQFPVTIAMIVLFGLANSSPLRGQETAERADTAKLQALLDRINQLEERVKTLEAEKAGRSALQPGDANPATSAGVAESSAISERGQPATAAPAKSSPNDGMAGHAMELPGGPKLNIRGFLDFNLGFGSVANPLIYPLAAPPTTVHNTFQFGEIDLFMSSKLSNSLSFLSEVVIGSDASNAWGIDVERAQLTYKPSEYLELSGGRVHTAIGYYNTAYHHGSWFQTATGRPFMYYFEDSGGILPVHLVGLEATGAIPHTGRLNAHWIAQVGNGESSSDPVQNFLSEKNHKAFNIAGFIKPDWVRGLQLGANYYNDVRTPEGLPHVNNSIVGAYIVYLTPNWEWLNEFQMQRDHSFGSPVTYNTPLGYTQISRKFGKYRPYFRWQEVNVPVRDPLYGSVGRYEGPSWGLRMDFHGYAALKVQYNRIYTRDALAKNGLDSQVAFTF